MTENNSRKESLNTSQNEPKEVLIGDYIIKKTIGSGTFSTVKLGIHRITQKKVAIKILDKNKIESKDDLERIIREMQILTEMDHQNVIKVFKIYEEENNFSLIMEYCEGGELFNYIVKKQRLTEEETCYFFYQIINGIEYIHSKGIAHRDLKPENLLIGKNKILKIIDFGLSNFYDGTKRLETPCGSPCYASPEMVKGRKYDGFNIDIWAIGVILFAMLCGYLPFEDDENDNDVLFSQIIKNKIDYPSFLSALSLDILKKILVSDPLKRITIDEIKTHEFYLKGERIFKEKFKEKEKEVKKESNKILNKIAKAFSSDDDYEKDIQKSDKNEKIEKNEKNEKSEKNEKIEKSEKEKNEKNEKSEKKEKIEKIEKIEKTANQQKNQNILFLDYLKSEKANKKNNIQHKAPKITMSKEESNNTENTYKYNSKNYYTNSNSISNTINNTNNNSNNNINIEENNNKKINQSHNGINNIKNNINTNKKNINSNNAKTISNNTNTNSNINSNNNTNISININNITNNNTKNNTIINTKNNNNINTKNNTNINTVSNTVNNTVSNTVSNTMNNSKIIHLNSNDINSLLNHKIDKIEKNRYNKSNNINDIRSNNFIINGNITGKDGLLNTFGINKKKKIFTKLQIKNHKDNRLGIQGIIPDYNLNNMNMRNKPYNFNLDILKNSKNSFEKQSLNSLEKNLLNPKHRIDINNLKIVDNKSNSRDRRKENSLKKKLLKYNIMELKQYNRLINQINININNISKSVHKNALANYTKPLLTNNNIINLNVILNDSLNNNKNLESLQMINTSNKIKKNLPNTPSLLRYIPTKKSTLPSITITDRIKPKLAANKFNSINNTKYLSTESNYEKVEKQKKIFLDNVGKKHEYLRLNYPKNYKLNANIYNY